MLEALGRALAIIEFLPDGTILIANDKFCRTLGYSLQEIEGKHHRIFVDPKDAKRPDYEAFWAKLVRGEHETRECKRIGKGGKEVWMQTSYSPVIDRKGKVLKVVAAATDITSEKLKNAELSGKLEAISLAQAVVEYTTAGEIITANAGFLDLVGYKIDDVRGRHHRMFMEPPAARSADYANLWRRLKAGETVVAECKRIGRGGKEIWIQTSFCPIFDMNKKVVKVVEYATDVSERVRTVAEFADGLSALADNDLQVRLDGPCDPAFESIRSDFNHFLEQLRTVVVAISDKTRVINAGVQQISISSGDLSLRTEQQATSLEQTAAALAEITSTVRKSAEGAQQASQVAAAAKADAVRSSGVMNDAVSAMVEINQSSTKITQIIGVIDEIAFQTNLLALNAGVEAARAGEAGRGFAVVAQEVRALAQRSTEAAREIKGLIASSSEQVKRGVALVDGTGQVLKNIVAKVSEIDKLITGLAKSTRDQSTGLTEVNTAVNQMDQVTQKNAAMADEATAAATNLVKQTQEMGRLLEDFRTDGANRAPVRSEPTRSRTAQPAKGGSSNPVHRAQARLVTALKSGGAEVAYDSWDEF